METMETITSITAMVYIMIKHMIIHKHFTDSILRKYNNILEEENLQDNSKILIILIKYIII